MRPGNSGGGRGRRCSASRRTSGRSSSQWGSSARRSSTATARSHRRSRCFPRARRRRADRTGLDRVCVAGCDRHPARAVRRTAVRHGGDRPRVRPDHAGLVPDHCGARRLWNHAASGGFCCDQSALRPRLSDARRRAELSRARRRIPLRDRRRGPLRRHGQFGPGPIRLAWNLVVFPPWFSAGPTMRAIYTIRPEAYPEHRRADIRRLERRRHLPEPEPHHQRGLHLLRQQSDWDLSGLVYLPHSSVTFSGAVNKSSTGQTCFTMVVDNITINGTGSIFATTRNARPRALHSPTAPAGGAGQLTGTPRVMQSQRSVGPGFVRDDAGRRRSNSPPCRRCSS